MLTSTASAAGTTESPVKGTQSCPPLLNLGAAGYIIESLFFFLMTQHHARAILSAATVYSRYCRIPSPFYLQSAHQPIPTHQPALTDHTTAINWRG